MANMYKLFAYPDMDFSQEAMENAFAYESFGTKIPNADDNAYYQGKRNMDITIEMWIADIEKGFLTMQELYDEFPKWFIDKVMPKGLLLKDKETRIEMIMSVRRCNHG